jgi:hypothetical protein
MVQQQTCLIDRRADDDLPSNDPFRPLTVRAHLLSITAPPHHPPVPGPPLKGPTKSLVIHPP